MVICAVVLWYMSFFVWDCTEIAQWHGCHGGGHLPIGWTVGDRMGSLILLGFHVTMSHL